MTNPNEEVRATPKVVLEDAVLVALKNGWTVESIVETVNAVESAYSAGETTADVQTPAAEEEQGENTGDETTQS